MQNLLTQPPVVKGKRRQAKDRYDVEKVLKVNSTGNWALVQWERRDQGHPRGARREEQADRVSEDELRRGQDQPLLLGSHRSHSR